MPAIKPPKFGRPELLRKLKPASRATLLNPFRDYFHGRGCPLPAVLDDDADYEAISLVLMSPDEHSPSELVETLEMLELLADPQCSFDFEQSAGDVVERLRESDDSAGDLAIKLLREAPDVAWQVFDRRALGMTCRSRRSSSSLFASAAVRFRSALATSSPPSRAWASRSLKSRNCTRRRSR